MEDMITYCLRHYTGYRETHVTTKKCNLCLIPFPEKINPYSYTNEGRGKNNLAASRWRQKTVKMQEKRNAFN